MSNDFVMAFVLTKCVLKIECVLSGAKIRGFIVNWLYNFIQLLHNSENIGFVQFFCQKSIIVFLKFSKISLSLCHKKPNE